MKIHTVAQGTAEWHALRASHFTASEAPAMMGASKYQTRTELLKAKKSGLVPEISSAQQVLFDRGHQAEAAARVIVERMIGEDLFPVVGTEGNLLASLDGMDMLGSTLFEHKLWNADLVAQVRAGELDPHYYWQLEQQLLVSGAERVIFVVSDGTEESFERMEYRPVPGRAEQLVAGWKQFEQDLAAFEVQAPAEPAAIGRAPDALPALRIEVTGMVTASNLREFREQAMVVLGSINTDLQTDQDFANADKAVKWCKGVEERLDAAKSHALSQTASIDELFRTLGAIAEETRAKRLELDKLVKARKETIRLEIKAKAETALAAHIAELDKGLAPVRMPRIAADIAGAMKGKKTVASLQDAADTELAKAKIEAGAAAQRIATNLRAVRELAPDHGFLFNDLQELTQKDPEAVTAIVSQRLAEHQQAEQRRQEAERERIRAELAHQPLQRHKCDGNHGGPRCADPECWNDDDESFVAQLSEQIGLPARRPAPVETITITRAEYDQLLADQRLLHALQAAGVDNWNGYDDALETLGEAA